MARPLRIEFDDAWYHIMNRGAGRRIIFCNNEDRENFLRLLDDIHQRYHVETHAYCLMDNHYHLLLHTPHSNVSRALRHLNGVYTQMFNHSHGCDGPLFRGRFKSLLVENDCYLTRLSRYIHLNPVEAKMVDSPENFF